MTRPEPDHKGAALFTDAFLSDPYPGFAAMRDQSPVLWLEAMNAWILTSYDAVNSAFRDERFRVNFSEYQVNRVGPSVVDEPYFKQAQNSLVCNDHPRHTRMRMVFRRALTQQRVSQLGDEIQQQANRFVDAMIEASGAEKSGEAELIEDYANRIPHAIISSLLGVPEEDRLGVAKFVRDYSPVLEVTPMSDRDLKMANDAASGLDVFFKDLLKKRAHQKRDDFISEVLTLNEDMDEPLCEDELAANFALVYFGGQDTQEKMFSNMILALSNNPDAMSRLVETPSDIDKCMTELLRFDSAGQFMGRTTAEELDLCGVTLPKGETVMCSMAAANHDPKYFPNPEKLALDRQAKDGQPDYMTFGTGRHSCLGQHLARANLPIMLKTLLTRLGPLSVDLANSERHQSIATRGFDKMPIAWGAAA